MLFFFVSSLFLKFIFFLCISITVGILVPGTPQNATALNPTVDTGGMSMEDMMGEMDPVSRSFIFRI